MPGRQAVGAELARGLQQVGELDRLVAVDAGHRRLAARHSSSAKRSITASRKRAS